MKEKCTMLVSTCDSYEDTWEAFFKSLKRYWPSFNMTIVLNTESKNYKMENLDIKTFNLFKNKKVPWGARLIEHLKKIDTEYVLFMLDDFFLVKPVNEKMINQCIKYMDENKNIAVFCFHRVDDKNNIPSKKYKNFELRPKNGKYRLNCQTAIWRRERLIKFINKKESPWDFEIYGSIRSRKFKDEFYSIIPEVEEPFNYNMYEQGTGICRGKWVKEVVIPLFKELEIKMDFSKRGFCNQEEQAADNRTFFQKCQSKYKKFVAWLSSLI